MVIVLAEVVDDRRRVMMVDNSNIIIEFHLSNLKGKLT